MAFVNFIDFNNDKNTALSYKGSVQSEFYEHTGICLLPNSANPYRQTTNVSGGIELEDWTALVVDLCTGVETDITAYFSVDSVFTDNNGDAQFNWSITNVPTDFGDNLVYLKVSQLIGETFYSNVFQFTSNESDKVTRLDYRATVLDVMQSIGVKIWYWQPLKNQELTTYYETSTRNTVTALIKSQKYQRWASDWMSNELLIKISEVFEQKYAYVNLVRAYLFEAIEPKEFQAEEQFAENILKISFNESDVYDPLYVPPVVDDTPSITLSSIVATGIQAIYSFSYANFTPTSLIFQRSQDEVSWTDVEAGVTSPQNINFSGTGVWYFRIQHAEAISNVIELDLGDTVNAVDDSVNVVKGATKNINVLFNDDLVGTTTITSVTVPSNGTATIIESGTKIEYTHDDSLTTSDSFNYTISNGITSDSATVNVTIIGGGGTSSTGFFTSTTGNIDSETSCGFILDATRYHNGANAQPTLGDYVFTDAALTSAFDGEDKYFPIENGRAIKINSSGQITDLYICGAGSA